MLKHRYYEKQDPSIKAGIPCFEAVEEDTKSLSGTPCPLLVHQLGNDLHSAAFEPQNDNSFSQTYV